jgi:hypothetical protein
VILRLLFKQFLTSGPVIIISGYINFGTVWTFSVVTVGMILPMILLFCLRNRFVLVLSKLKENENAKETLPMTEIDSE